MSALETLVQQLREPLSAYFLTNAIARDYGSGATFPTSPATGARFFRTDLGWACYYDGTRWLTQHEYAATLTPYTPVVPGAAFYTGAAGVALAYAAPRTDASLYLTRWAIAYILDTNQSGVNYWTLQLAANATTLTTQTTQNATALGNWYTREGTDGADRGAVSFVRLIASAKAGAPGGIWATATVYYRLIVP